MGPGMGTPVLSHTFCTSFTVKHETWISLGHFNEDIVWLWILASFFSPLWPSKSHVFCLMNHDWWRPSGSPQGVAICSHCHMQKCKDFPSTVWFLAFSLMNHMISGLHKSRNLWPKDAVGRKALMLSEPLPEKHDSFDFPATNDFVLY